VTWSPPRAGQNV